ncbi:hypothetical protein ALC56_05953 [Trachymyrmex septentrionalis]|uniref:Uncharacterized protein n=1 Tax=Trachymyrmex septentrionalis TaxID=34720 RepID=A0A195FFI5_9HYME|nr:hypothetical protein ALC56_05953 [Trachymyrmex septentrionalis]
MLVSRWDLSRGHLNFAYARNVLLADGNLLRTRRHLIVNNQFNECDEILAYERLYATKQLLFPWNASRLVLRWTVFDGLPPSKFESHIEMSLRNLALLRTAAGIEAFYLVGGFKGFSKENRRRGERAPTPAIPPVHRLQKRAYIKPVYIYGVGHRAQQYNNLAAADTRSHDVAFPPSRYTPPE